MKNKTRKLAILVAGVLGAALLFALPGAAMARDRNHDRISDRWERHHHLSLQVRQTRHDQDKDGLKNLGEFRNRTNPRNADTDNDGLDDGDEVATDNDPKDEDTDNDGVEDGEENAGTVTSFDGTTLVITLADNSTVSGEVTDGTEISCESQSDNGDSQGDDDQGDATASHDEGDQGEDPGDNEQGEDPGDDDQGEDGEGDGETACSTADLTPGAVVHEAELKVTSEGAVFEEVQLVK